MRGQNYKLGRGEGIGVTTENLYIRILSDTNIRLYTSHAASTDFTHVLTVCGIGCVHILLKILEVHTFKTQINETQEYQL